MMTKHAIIIENKFDRYGNPAQDQPKQLERYYNHGKDDKKYEDFILILISLHLVNMLREFYGSQ